MTRERYAEARDGALTQAEFTAAIIRDSLLGVIAVLLLALAYA